MKLSQLVERGFREGELVMGIGGDMGMVVGVRDDETDIMFGDGVSTHWTIDWLTNGWVPLECV